MINCILLDDESKALKMLEKKLLKNHPNINILATFQEPEKAVDAIRQLQPDLVFLDIAMPNMSGFDVLSQFKDPEFEIIFVTAYDSYAIQAIKHAAIGYIVKPIDDDALKAAILKAEKNISMKVARENNRALLDLLNQKSNTLAIPTQDGYIFIKVENLVRLEGADGYTKIICKNDQEFLSSYNLGKFIDLLKNLHFFQAHRSHIINLKYVTRYLNEGYIELLDQYTVPLSKAKRKEFLTLMGQQ